MKKLPNSLLNKAKNYDQIDDKNKGKLLDVLYNGHRLSWAQIAKLCGTYANKVRRDAKKLGTTSRSKSEAQSVALQSGRHEHPTKGKGHSETTKIKISESVASEWEAMPESKREEIREEAKRKWNLKSDEEIRAFQEASFEAVRLAAKEGSALEKYLLEELVRAGYKVDFHKEHWVIRQNLQIDLFIPALNVAIEVDGPSHFENIWGQDVLQKNKLRDREKNGLLLQRNCVIIRIKQVRSLSLKYKREILNQLLEILGQVKKKRPAKGERFFVLGE